MSGTTKLKQRLQKFIKEAEELEVLDECEENGFTKKFRELRLLGISDRDNNTYPAEEGKKDENIKKNRYKDILPFDETRVRLDPIPDEPGSDYINANFIKGANGKTGYIACQGPLPHTVVDFWRMLWQYKVEVLVMVCREVEKSKAKCERYWPKGKAEEREFGNIHVKLLGRGKLNEFFHMQTLSVWENGDEANSRSITHFHYTGWLDHDIPNDYSDVIDLITRMRENQTADDIPPVIHCSAGCGRTGTICAIDYAWHVLKSGKLTDDFSLYDIVKDMRSQRQSMVQTPEQYQVVHLAVKRMFEEQLTILEDHNYENFEPPAKKEAKRDTSSQAYGNFDPTAGQKVEKPTTSMSHVGGKNESKPGVPAAKPKVPNLPNLPPGNSNPANKSPSDKKPARPDNKPLLSPKSPTENDAKARQGRRPSLDTTAEDHGKRKLSKTSSLDPSLGSYENVRLIQEEEKKREREKGKHVTRINVGAGLPVTEQGKGKVEKEKTPPNRREVINQSSHTDEVTKPSIAIKSLQEMFGKSPTNSKSPMPVSSNNSNAPMPISSSNNKKYKAPAPPTSAPSYANHSLPATAPNAAKGKPANGKTYQNSSTPQHSKTGAQEQKPTVPVDGKKGSSAQTASKLPASTSSKPPASTSSKPLAIKVTGAIVDHDPMYAEISPKTPVADRMPVPLPNPPLGSTASSAASPYEDVCSDELQNYSYAEPNATNKWGLQDRARHGEQMAQMNNANPLERSFKGSTYEDVDLGAGNGIDPDVPDFVVLGGLREETSGDPPPAVPAKTKEAYIEVDEDGQKEGGKLELKTKLKNIFIHPKQKKQTNAVDGETGGATSSQPSRAIFFNNKEIPQFKKRGKRPKGPRTVPMGGRNETSL